jgi:MscS family membrane protein
MPVLVGLPLLWMFTGILGRLASPWLGFLRSRIQRSRGESPPEAPVSLLPPKPVRLLVVALLVRVILMELALPLAARQLWAIICTTITIVASAWLAMGMSDRGERFLKRRLETQNNTGATAVLRLGRRTVDGLIIFIGVLVVLYTFGVNPTAALAGLGVGGIAVALAAQKTLENVIGGISVIADHVVRVGDTLNIGNTNGVVEDVGLRSTQIRTPDRTLVSVPNGQLANVQLENVSARDRFRFIHYVGLRYETSAAVMRSVVEGMGKLLAGHAAVDPGSIRVRFLRMGGSSLDIEVLAYMLARDWPHFLEIQQELLLKILELVERAGAQIAFPSQTMYLAADITSQQHGEAARLPLLARADARPAG